MWVRILEAKYGRGEDWIRNAKKGKGSVWWRDLRRVCQLDEEGGWVRNGLRRKMGDGREIKFWEECWVGQTPLKISHNRIFLVSAQQGKPICDMGEWVGEEWRWKLEWRRE